jgi:predicted transcriptional regulator
MRALIIKEPWASKVVSGEKTIELRTMQTTKVGQEIYIAKAGTKTLIGRVTIEKCVRLTLEDYMCLQDKHLARDFYIDKFENKKIYGWYLINPVRFDKPIVYEHPRGAQIWVVIPDNV